MPLVGLQRIPRLLLARMVVRHGERHEMLERDSRFAIEGDERRADVRELEPPLHDERRYAEARGDILDRLPGVDEWRNASNSSAGCMGSRPEFSGKADLHRALVAHDETRHGVVRLDALLPDQQLQRAPAAAAGDTACVVFFFPSPSSHS